MNIALSRRRASRMPARIHEINRHNWIERMPRSAVIRTVVALDLAIVALVVTGFAGWLQ